MTTFLDTNILIALTRPEEPYHQWSIENVILRKQVGPTIISDLVYCEFCAAMTTQEQVEEVIRQLSLERMPNSDRVWYRASRAFKRYKEDNNGPKERMLADFIIGALADAESAPLMTANARDFRGYFPDLELITPR